MDTMTFHRADVPSCTVETQKTDFEKLMELEKIAPPRRPYAPMTTPISPPASPAHHPESCPPPPTQHDETMRSLLDTRLHEVKAPTIPVSTPVVPQIPQLPTISGSTYSAVMRRPASIGFSGCSVTVQDNTVNRSGLRPSAFVPQATSKRLSHAEMDAFITSTFGLPPLKRRKMTDI